VTWATTTQRPSSSTSTTRELVGNMTFQMTEVHPPLVACRVCDTGGPHDARHVDSLGWLCPDCLVLDAMTFAEAYEEALRVSDSLRALGRSDAHVAAWWHMEALPELGDHTPREAWLSGNYAGVCWAADCL